jgi:hypothetical protein
MACDLSPLWAVSHYIKISLYIETVVGKGHAAVDGGFLAATNAGGLTLLKGER